MMWGMTREWDVDKDDKRVGCGVTREWDVGMTRE